MHDVRLPPFICGLNIIQLRVIIKVTYFGIIILSACLTKLSVRIQRELRQPRWRHVRKLYDMHKLIIWLVLLFVTPFNDNIIALCIAAIYFITSYICAITHNACVTVVTNALKVTEYAHCSKFSATCTTRVNQIGFWTYAHDPVYL